MKPLIFLVIVLASIATLGAQEGLPVGTIVAFAGARIPSGWLACDGTEKEEAQYPKLAELIRNTYGPASDHKFKLPDLQGRVPLGNGRYVDPTLGPVTRTLGDKEGAASVRLTLDQIAEHGHVVSGYTYGDNASHTGVDVPPFPETRGFLEQPESRSTNRTGATVLTLKKEFVVTTPGGQETLTSSHHDHNMAIRSQGKIAITEKGTDPNPVSVLPPYVVMMYIIKY